MQTIMCVVRHNITRTHCSDGVRVSRLWHRVSINIRVTGCGTDGVFLMGLTYTFEGPDCGGPLSLVKMERHTVVRRVPQDGSVQSVRNQGSEVYLTRCLLQTSRPWKVKSFGIFLKTTERTVLERNRGSLYSTYGGWLFAVRSTSRQRR